MAVTIKGDSNVNLDFSSGGRVTGDFSNATLTSRAMLQTSTTNGSSGVYVLPNGTSQAASWQATNNSDPTNASKVLIATNGTTDVQLVSGRNGTGTYLPLTFYTNGSEQMRIDTSGNVGIGTSSPAYKLDVNGQIRGDFVIRATQGAVTSYLVGNSGGFGAVGTASNHPILFNTNDTERARIDSSGNLLVNTTSNATSAKVNVYKTGNIPCITATQGDAGSYCYTTSAANNGGGYYHFSFREGTTERGTITSNGTSTTYSTSSDYRLKHDIAPMTGALAKVAALKPVTYKWNADGSAGEGFIAHELAEVVPQCVTGEKDAVETYTDEDGNEKTQPKYQGIDTSFLVATLTAAIQEQQALIADLTARIAALEAK